MKLSTLFAVTAIIALLFGLSFVLIPAMLLSLYGVEVNANGIQLARLLGAAFIGFGIISWLVRDSGWTAELRAIVLAFAVTDLLGFGISLTGQLQGISNALGWSTVVIYLLIGLGFGYFYLRPPRIAAPT